MMQLTLIQKFAVWVLPVLFAITVHEVAHGWVASKLGDTTAKMLGRLTLNPLKHIDPIGTVLVPAILFFTTRFVFGLARPVPVNFYNLRKPRRDAALVALSGPVANLLMALIWAVIIKLSMLFISAHHPFLLPIVLMGQAGILINIVLMVGNLVPIPPLDGSRIVSSLLPRNAARHYNSFGRYGFFILLALMLTGLFWQIIAPFVSFFINLIMLIFQLPGSPFF
jgi:Zn-dependent protease